MYQRLRDNSCKVALCRQSNRPTKVDGSRRAKYGFVDLCYRLAGLWPSARISRLPWLELEGQALSLPKRFSARQALLSPAKIYKTRPCHRNVLQQYGNFRLKLSANYAPEQDGSCTDFCATRPLISVRWAEDGKQADVRVGASREGRDAYDLLSCGEPQSTAYRIKDMDTRPRRARLDFCFARLQKFL